ncbi:CGNR zinc finger domain-containing protein [Rhodococcus oryzae]|uniref:CGNR zinc finger domain-containing protein n=1 Tax=Rhodococcus oryzae TaxID=2571143 RepID=UPI00371EC205
MSARESAQAADAPPFRLDNEYLPFRFTATLTDRHGARRERLVDAARLTAWLDATGLRLPGAVAAPADLATAHDLREAIHRVGTAVAEGREPDPDDRETINALARDTRAFPMLDEQGKVMWSTDSRRPVRDGLGIVARSAIDVLGGPVRSRVTACRNQDCRGLFVDTSRGRNRRWCSMNTCGNKSKKAALKNRA